MRRGHRVLKIFLSYPFTWLVLLEILIIEWAFMLWFKPPLTMKLVGVGIGIIMLAVWPILFLRSQVFHTRYNRMPYETKMKELEKLLKSCSESFRKPAEDCLVLLDNVRQEFQSRTFQTELDQIFQNLFDLSRNHVQLYSRLQQFGTAQQKHTMETDLKQQVRSVENSLSALKAFSGHLTLLHVHPEDYEKI